MERSDILTYMFGVIGILLSIPLAAILDFAYNDYILPTLERRQIK